MIGAAVVIRAASLAIERLQIKLGSRQADLEWQRRASTIGGILTSLVTLAVAFVAVLMLLRELSIDVMPILTGAGIVGLAIGFGAQNLVRDFISGFFLILEDQVRVGDIARINGVSGMVEQINLRTIVVRDEEGAVQVFPNGTITTLANRSKQFAYAIVDVRVVVPRKHRPRHRHDAGNRHGDGARPGLGRARARAARDSGGDVARRHVCDDPRQIQDAAAQPREGFQRAAAAHDDDVRGKRHQAVRGIQRRGRTPR